MFCFLFHRHLTEILLTSLNHQAVLESIHGISSGNIFHLLANVITLLTFRRTINPTAWIAAVAATFLPMSGTPTLGMSALLFAHLGTTWAPTKGLYPMCRRVLSWAIVIGLFPGVNMLIHIYALFLGYFMQVLYPYPKKSTRNH